MAKVKSTINKVAKRIDVKQMKTLGIESFDIDNLYPQRVNNIVNDSGTATTAIRTFIKFVSGKGATDKAFGNSKIGKRGLTVDKFIRKIVSSKGHFQGLAIHFNYNGLGQKTEINFVPFEYNRLTLSDDKNHPDMVAIYDDWGETKRKKIEKKLIKYVHKYNPAKVFEQVESIEVDENGRTPEDILAEKWSLYNGQILYWTPDGDGTYPLAPFDSVLEDMITEAQVKRFKNNTAAKNFLASHIIKSGVELDENGEAVEESSLGKSIENFGGGDGAATMMHVELENEEDFFELIKVDIQDYDGLYQFTEESSRDSILRNFLIPPALLIATSGKLGSSNEIADAAKYYNDITADDRKIIEDILRETFKGYAFPINATNDYSIEMISYNRQIEAAYFPFYSSDEIRESKGDQPSQDQGSGETVLAVTLGVEGNTALAALLSNELLSELQKIGSMKVLFGLSQEQAEEMLGINTNPKAQ
jgi:hypothetical protein